MHPSTGIRSYPVLSFPTAPGGTEIYQAISSVHNFPSTDSALRNVLLHDEHLVRNSFQGYAGDEHVRVSRIFHKKPADNLALLAEDEKLCLQPPARLPLTGIADVIASLFLGFQLRIWLSQMPSSLESMTTRQRGFLPEVIGSTLNNQVEFLRRAVAGTA